jgi:ribonuclease HI
MFNVFLLPKLELALRYVHGPGTNGFISHCDAAIIGCIKHAVASPLRLSHSAIALALHINLPSWMEATAKVSELFLRLNSTQCRWGRLGRILMRKVLPSGLADGTAGLPHANSGTRLSRTARLAVDQLGWTLQLHQQRRAGGRSQHLFSVEPAGPLPDGSLCSGSQDLELSAGPIKVAHDLWQSWGATAPAPPGRVHVYTDGSYDAASLPHSTSAWAITVADRWFDSNFGGIPADEHLLQAVHIRGASLFGASINCTRGVYAAELQAIARALAMFPSSCELEIHSDSQGALAGIHAYETQLNERRRLRMSSRPLLQLIHHLLQRRAGVTHTSHVKAHTSNTDCHSVGNRLTDFQANLARAKPDKPSPLCLRELPLRECEHHMFVLDGQGVVLCDDIRRAALARLKSTSLSKWMSRTDGRGDLAGPAMIDLGRAVLRHGSVVQQTTLVHVATNSIEFFWPAGSVRNDQLKRLQCVQCNQVLTLPHLAECLAPPCLQFHSRLLGDIRNILAAEVCTRDWRIANSRLTLSELLFSLFPLAATATAQERLRHLTCLFVGAFTDRQANAAAKRLGFPSAEEGRPCLIQLRLQCLESLHQVYRSWKEAAGA